MSNFWKPEQRRESECRTSPQSTEGPKEAAQGKQGYGTAPTPDAIFMKRWEREISGIISRLSLPLSRLDRFPWEAGNVPGNVHESGPRTQLDLSVAVDLTASNGDPRKKSSLHYIKDPSSPSPYELVIRAIADICQFYNRSRRYNAYGFGAIIPGQRKVSPVFNLVCTLVTTC
ncbi:unnamed protein product [Heligmosomoides polygyrus]|uniref:Copine domain-containing protein n=1 Tax=Heligmosomoides polygyrus TaxID=6339 RepID=A0A183GQ86_HELPZ|nr:unnamed protein product [Heligmosomoides polygyrus]